MKTLLVLTDFTDNATHAAIAAVTLAAKLQANILLFNSFTRIPATPYYDGGPWIAEDLTYYEEESKLKLDELYHQLELKVNNLESLQHKPTIHSQYGEGDLGSNVAEIIRDRDIELIVMGASTETAMDHIFFGSDTNSVIRKASCPVLIIPQGAEIDNLKHITFATDFNDEDSKAVRYLVKLGNLFKSQIDVVHVEVTGKKPTSTDAQQMAFTEQIARFKYPKLSYKEIRGDDITNRLQRLCHENNSNLLSMVHHKHSFLAQLVKQSTTKKAMAEQKIPMLVFSSDMDD